MNWEFNLLKKLGIIKIVISSVGLVSDFQAVAETVEVSGGDRYEGDITADNLNGKVVCTYSNGDCEASRPKGYRFKSFNRTYF